jgi:hypothetical protein
MTASSPEEIAAAKQFGLTFDFYLRCHNCKTIERANPSLVLLKKEQ